MEYGFPFLAAIVVAVCNGLAAVLQKVSADKKHLVVTFNVGVILALLRNVPYLVGTLLDILAGGFTLLASHFLPLFLVQSLIATSIIFTSIFEFIILKQKITLKKLLAMAVSSSRFGHNCHCHYIALPRNPGWRLIQKLSFLHIARICDHLIGLWCLRTKTHLTAFGLAALSGVCFGMTSIGGRIFLVYPHPLWYIATNTIALAIVIYATLGPFFLYHCPATNYGLPQV